MAFTIAAITHEPQWEVFLLRHRPQALFQSWLWGELQKQLGSRVTRFGLFDKDTLVGIWQTVKVSARRGSFLHVRHGPIFSEQKKPYWRQVLSFLRRQAREETMWFVRVSPLLPPPVIQPVFGELHLIPAAIHAMDAERCWVLDLELSEDDLLRGMRKTTRYEIRRAEKAGVEIFSTKDPKKLAVFFDLYAQTSERHGFVPHTGIRQEFDLFSKRNQATLYLGYDHGKVVSAAIILYYGNQAIYHHGASVRTILPVSYAVQWEAIKDAKKRGMKVYNFWGIAPENKPNHPWRGITLFKKGFGGREIEYIHAHDMPVSPLYVLSRSVETVRRIRRGYD